MTDVQRVMKACQIGCRNLNDANDLLAECYGTIGKLSIERDAALESLRTEEAISFRRQMQEYAAQRDQLVAAVKKAIAECCDLMATPAGDALAAAIANAKD